MRVRIYFNSHAEGVLRWSYDYGNVSTEVKVQGWKVHGVPVADGFDDEVGAGNMMLPRVWVEVLDAKRVLVKDGIAHVYGS